MRPYVIRLLTDSTYSSILSLRRIHSESPSLLKDLQITPVNTNNVRITEETVYDRRIEYLANANVIHIFK